jgi:phosphoglycerate dehydrogenase-like enzyme
MRLIHHLPAAMSGMIAAMPGITAVETLPHGDERWALPPDADILFVLKEDGESGAARAAAAPRPKGWPGRVRLVQIASSGLDGYPDWLFEAPLVASSAGTTTIPIAEYVLAFMLAHAKQLEQSTLGHSRWPNHWPSRAEIMADPPGTLEGRTLGLFGIGRIGQRVAALARAFDMEVIATRASAAPIEGVRLVPIEELARRSDHLVLAAPITPATRGLFDADLLARMKPGAHLINVARGAIVDTDALKAALDSGRLWASLDVTDPEPLPPGHWLFSHPRARVTPHVSWNSPETGRRILERLMINLGHLAAGTPLVDVVRG